MKISYRKTEMFEFVEYDYYLDRLVVIRENEKLFIRFLFPVGNGYLVCEYDKGYFKHKGKQFSNFHYPEINEIPDWFKNWFQENVNRKPFLKFSAQDQLVYDYIQNSRTEYWQKIGFLPK
ncbi:MAG: hypothetical protein HC912_03100 [Saprospiraceae bacterium]|nr:hypothetical protein [Saprospiraceae bacterium]